MQISIPSLADLPTVARQLLNICKNEKKIAFYGTLGAGKTTLIKQLCQELGVEPTLTSSPTYAIVNEYQGKAPIYHLDLYRLNNIEEALNIGIEDYLDSSHYCLIEWPQIIEPMMDGQFVAIDIEVGKNEERILTIRKGI